MQPTTVCAAVCPSKQVGNAGRTSVISSVCKREEEWGLEVLTHKQLVFISCTAYRIFFLIEIFFSHID